MPKPTTGVQLLMNILHRLNVKATTTNSAQVIEQKTMAEINRLLERPKQYVLDDGLFDELERAKSILQQRLSIRSNSGVSAKKADEVKPKDADADQLQRENQLLRSLLKNNNIPLPEGTDDLTCSTAATSVNDTPEDTRTFDRNTKSGSQSESKSFPRMSNSDMDTFRNILSFMDTHQDFFCGYESTVPNVKPIPVRLDRKSPLHSSAYEDHLTQHLHLAYDTLISINADLLECVRVQRKRLAELEHYESESKAESETESETEREVERSAELAFGGIQHHMLQVHEAFTPTAPRRKRRKQ